jgi:hypothetical protein
MRRGQLSRRSLIIVILAGFFSLISIFLDQQVIQQEDKVRNIDIEVQNKIEKINELDINSMSVLMLEDRIQMMTNYYSFYSTLFYKIFLHLETDADFKKHFNENAKHYMTSFIHTDIKDIIYDLSAVHNDLTTMSFYYYKYQDKALEERIKKLLKFENPLKESLLKKIKNLNFKSEDLSSNEVYLIYKSLFQLNKQFALSIKTLNDISNYFDKEQEKTENEFDKFMLDSKKIKIIKNYFILLSILAQIMSLMALLFLFKNIIKEES